MNKNKRSKWLNYSIFSIFLATSITAAASFFVVHNNSGQVYTIQTQQAATWEENPEENVIRPVLQGYNPETPDKLPMYNIRRLPNINTSEINYSSLDVTAPQAKSIIIRNIQTFFASTLTAQAFDNNLKKDSFKVLNRPTLIYVDFTLQSVYDDATGKTTDKTFSLIMNGFQEASWAQMTWLIFMGPVVLIVILAVTILIVATKSRLKKKRKPGVVDGEYIIE